MQVGYELYGGNADAYNSQDSEILLAGAAGTGKSLALALKAFTICSNHPGARCLIVRKTRESLTESVLVTWERDVLAPGTPGHAILTRNPTLRRVRQSYQFPNGSVVVVGGLDKPDKVLSSEWDYIYVPEVTDLDLVDWETLGGRLRAGRVPFQQLAADCNPTSPHVWVYKRYLSGKIRLYTSTHQQNPRFFNRATGEWTPDGQKYLARLELMTGARRDRFLRGLWVSAEGMVYEFRESVHMHPPGWSAPKAWPRVWGIDWGKRAPTVLGIWAVDPQSRMHLTREVYQTHLRPDVLGRRAAGWLDRGDEPRPQAVVCDHDTGNEGYKELFEKASGLHLLLADKEDRHKGIQSLQARFDLADDGKPRIMFVANTLDHEEDGDLADAGLPTSGISEIVGYVWDEDQLKDEPIDYNDHFADMTRYSARYIDTYLPVGGVPKVDYGNAPRRTEMGPRTRMR